MQLPVLQPSESASTLLPMKLFQNVSEGPPNSALQVAVKNNQPAIVYFKDKIPLQALFVEDGRMERGTFLEVIYHPPTYSGSIYVDFIYSKVFEVAWSVTFVSGSLLSSSFVSEKTFLKCDVSLAQTWKALPDSHEVAKELPNALMTNVDATVEKLATSNLFFIARRTLKDTNQEVQHCTVSSLSMMVYDFGSVSYGMYSESTNHFSVSISL